MAVNPEQTIFATGQGGLTGVAQLQAIDPALALRFDTLSMGMSDDLEAAIAEGATLVRVGTALFGRRQTLTEASVRPST